MKAIVIGSGAVGCILGGALIRNGHEVTFVARGKNLDALVGAGLTISWPGETWTFDKVRAIPQDAPKESFDLMLFCVKGYDWESAASYLDNFPSKRILTFQNGVRVHHELEKKFGNSVYGSVIYVAADRTNPGEVACKGMARVVLDQSLADVGKALGADTVNVQLSNDIELDLWRKYLFLCSFSAINTLSERSMAPLLAEESARVTWTEMMREIVRVANASGIALSEKDIETIFQNVPKYSPNTTSSLLADTLRKQKTEVELLQGNLIRMAAEHNIDAPVARTVYALLKLKTSF